MDKCSPLYKANNDKQSVGRLPKLIERVKALETALRISSGGE